MTEPSTPAHPCTRAHELLPEYWQGELSAAARTGLERHLEGCPDCAQLASLWRDLGELPEAKPDPLERRRFAAMLARYQADHRAWRGSWREAWAAPFEMLLRPLAAVLALGLLLAGFGGGWWVRGNSRTSAPDQVADQAGEIAALREKVDATNQLVVLSMLQQQSANDRLEGVDYSRHLNQPDPRVLEALLHSLEYDPSPDVRLAALDALENSSAGRTSPEVSSGLIAAFEHQSSPLVEVALVDSLLDLRPPAAQALFEKISADPAYSAEVRQRAAWGLSQWKQNQGQKPGPNPGPNPS